MQSLLSTAKQIGVTIRPNRISWLCLFASAALLTRGFYFSLLPLSQTISSQPWLFAVLEIAILNFLLAGLIATGWLFVRKEESPEYIVSRVSLTILLASLICTIPVLNPLAQNLFFKNGLIKPFRVGVFFISMMGLLGAFYQRWGTGWSLLVRGWMWFLGGVLLLGMGIHFRMEINYTTNFIRLGIIKFASVLGVGLLLWIVKKSQLSRKPLKSGLNLEYLIERMFFNFFIASLLASMLCKTLTFSLFFIMLFVLLHMIWIIQSKGPFPVSLSEALDKRNTYSWYDVIAMASVFVIVIELAMHRNELWIHLKPPAFILNVALVTSAIMLSWGIFGKGLFSVFLVMIGYGFIGFANAMKLLYLHVNLQPGDEAYLSELFFFRSYASLGSVVLALFLVVLTALLLIWSWRSSQRRVLWKKKLLMGLLGIGITACICVFPWIPAANDMFSQLGIRAMHAKPVPSSQRNGLLVELILQMPNTAINIPPGYSQDAIDHILAKETQAPTSSENAPLVSDPALTKTKDRPVNVIVFFFESLINPADLGRTFQREALPNFKQLLSQGVSGYAISPRFANGSAESEFEFITGMSCAFLPDNSCAYGHYVKHRLPSLVSLTEAKGNRSAAVKCVYPGFYFFDRAYQFLGVDTFCADENFQNPKLDRQWRVSDESFVDQILQLTENPPYFILGENLGSHGPYLLDPDANQPSILQEGTGGVLEAYLQSLAYADQHLGRMIEELKQREERVVVLVVGDHHPPISTSHYNNPVIDEDSQEAELFRRRTPFVIWKNFNDAEGDSAPPKEVSPELCDIDPPGEDTYVSLNFLSLLLLREAGIEPTGLLKWNEKLFEACPVVSKDLYYQDGVVKLREELSPEVQQRIQEYELLQYDLLHGEEYTEKYWGESPVELENNFNNSASNKD